MTSELAQLLQQVKEDLDKLPCDCWCGNLNEADVYAAVQLTFENFKNSNSLEYVVRTPFPGIMK